MFKIFLPCMVALALLVSGCTTSKDIDAAIQQSAPSICAAAVPLHAAFLVVAASGEISDRTIKREADAWAVLLPICEDPKSANSTTILIAAANAYIVISQAVREAKVKEVKAEPNG